MNEHFIVTIDRGRLRIYSEARSFDPVAPRLEIVEAMDFPPVARGYGDEGPGSASPFAGGSGGSTPPMGDDRHRSRREQERKNVAVLAAELNTFLQNRPDASWDLAATPSLFQTVIEALSPETRRRLKRVLSKDLVNQNSEEVRSHFATAGR